MIIGGAVTCVMAPFQQHQCEELNMPAPFNVTNPDFNPSNSEPTNNVKISARELQSVIEANVPETARRTLALRALEQVVYNAVRAIHDGDA